MPPFERLRGLLEAERERGAPFADAWARAVALTLAETAGRETWAEVFGWSEAAWCRAYEDRPRTVIDWLAPLDEEPRYTPAPGERVLLLG